MPSRTMRAEEEASFDAHHCCVDAGMEVAIMERYV